MEAAWLREPAGQQPPGSARHGDGIVYAGLTFDGSADGRPIGRRAHAAIACVRGPAAATTAGVGREAAVEFSVAVPPLAAVLLLLE